MSWHVEGDISVKQQSTSCEVQTVTITGSDENQMNLNKLAQEALPKKKGFYRKPYLH